MMKVDLNRYFKVKSKDHPFGGQIGSFAYEEDRDGVKWIALDFVLSNKEISTVRYAHYQLEAV